MCGLVFSFKYADFCKGGIKGLFYKCKKCVALFFLSNVQAFAKIILKVYFINVRNVWQ